MANPVSNNPNASLAAGSTGIGVVAIYILGLFGVNPPPEVAVAGAGAFTSLFLFIGKSGLSGLPRLIWKGGGS